MTIIWPPSVVGAIARRRAVILIGSGVSANSSTDAGRHPATWGAFLASAYQKIGKKIPHIQRALKRFAYLEACDFIKSELGEEWASTIRAEFLDPVYKPAPIHKAIFDLDARLVASLNFDKIYETYASAASEGTSIVKNYYDGDIREAVAGNDRYIIKPHGSVDTVSKMIFTLEEYGKARTEHANFYDVLSALLHTHLFICIGCGLSDPDLQLIFEDYRYKYQESPHYMTLPAPLSEPEKALIKRTRGINILTYNVKDGHRELTESLESLVNLVSVRRQVLADSQSW